MPKTHTIRLARRNGATTINLAQKRTWYAEGDAGDQQLQSGQQGEGQSPNGKYTPATIEDAAKIIEELTKRLGERDSDLEKYKRDLSTYTAAQRKQLEEQGNHKALADQYAAEVARLKPIEERATALEAIIRESNESRIKNVPEQMRGLIPSDYPPEKLQRWLNANEAQLAKQPAPNYDAGAGLGSGGGNSGSTPKLTADELDVAKRMGMSAEDYAKAKSKLPKKE